MLEDDVEIVRHSYEAFNAGDYATTLSLMSPDIEYHELEGMPGAGAGRRRLSR
jgi:ketosteroid isomerase-like protein